MVVLGVNVICSQNGVAQYQKGINTWVSEFVSGFYSCADWPAHKHKPWEREGSRTTLENVIFDVLLSILLYSRLNFGVSQKVLDLDDWNSTDRESVQTKWRVFVLMMEHQVDHDCSVDDLFWRYMSQKLISKATEFSSRGPSRANWMGISCNNRCFNVGVHDHRQTDPPQLCALEIGRRGMTAANGPTRNGTTGQRTNGPTGNGTTGQREGANGTTETGPAGRGQRAHGTMGTGPRDTGNHSHPWNWMLLGCLVLFDQDYMWCLLDLFIVSLGLTGDDS